MTAQFANPSLQLLVKLGSIIVHADEYLSPDGHDFDRDTILSLLGDPDVKQWLDQMNAATLLPRKRNA